LALALDESLKEDRDLLEQNDGVSFIYEKTIAPFVDGKVIDYQGGPQGGFTIKSEGLDSNCGSCC
jgi:Fe-S cluster assembly iron-binding protein IscA